MSSISLLLKYKQSKHIGKVRILPLAVGFIFFAIRFFPFRLRLCLIWWLGRRGCLLLFKLKSQKLLLNYLSLLPYAMLLKVATMINPVFVLSDPKNRSFYCSLFIVVSLICGAYFIGSASIDKEYKEKLTRWKVTYDMQNMKFDTCKKRCQPSGTEALPDGIVAKTSDLEMRPLWGSSMKNRNSTPTMSLLAIAVGIKQKEIVDRIVRKFIPSDFVVMLFHYDGVVDKWRDLPWSDSAIHVSAMNQTKWWFAKRFLHPDIVTEYKYIFLWDEDLGVENFDPKRYLSIIRDEGLEISQPALDPVKSEVYHPITARVKKSRVHRRFYKFKGSGRCDDQSSGPPCIGWVEMMAPAFSRAAWQCVWYMIQNDLIHAWGLDLQLGYCAQGDRTKNVGVVDAEYIVHLGLPTLGVTDDNKGIDAIGHSKKEGSRALTPSAPPKDSDRAKVRMQSFIDMRIFKERWIKAVKEDNCWADPY